MNPQHYATYNAQPPPQQQQHYGRTSSAASGAQYATAGRTASMSGGGMLPPPLNAWSPPSPQEHQYYDILFSIADEEKRNAIGGRIAVAFFSRSGVDKMHLREIWTIADSQQRSELSRNEFYVAMRLISMAQRGEAVTAQRFYELAATPFPLPNIDGVPPPVQQMQTQMQQPPQQSVATPAAPSQGSYAITDEEKQRYDGIFQQYDTDHDGFLHGGEAVQLFGMSGLDRGVLREIWSLADRGQDSRLDVKEFYIAMHMIVCVSKRGLPLPKELPSDMAESVFGPSRSSFTSPSTDPLASLGGLASMGSTSSRSNSMAVAPPATPSQLHQPPPPVVPTPPPTQANQDPMDAFAGLSPAIETTQQSRTGSFGRTNSGSSQAGSHSSLPGMTLPTPRLSLDSSMASLSVGAPSPAASTTGSFSGASVNGGMGLSSLAHGSSSQFGLGAHVEPPRDRAGSVGSVSSFTSVSTEASISHGMGSGLSQGPPPAQLGNANMGSFHGMGGPPQMPPMHHSGMPGTYTPVGMSAAPAPAKPFLSDEGEAAAVRQLEQSNEALAQTLQGVEKKQHAIELLSDKLRELDQLRHELVTLSLKREAVRAASTPAPNSSPQHATVAADSEAIRAVEQTLRTLIDGENALIQTLRADISQYERELAQGGLSSASPNVSVGFGGLASPAASAAVGGSASLPSPLTSAALSDATPKTTFEAFDGFGSSSPAPEAFAASDAFANFNFN